jgi:hypothetical protein
VASRGTILTVNVAVGSEISDIRKAFPWETLGEGTVVDVGGSNGHISIALAKVSFASLPHLSSS